MLFCSELEPGALESLFTGFDIQVEWVGAGEPIPGSHWGEPEAGIRRGTLHVRPDSPVHSALHEGSHLICMGDSRRAAVDTDAEGDDLEEAAVCLLQIQLADHLGGVGRERVMTDMDAWGYSFRLGSTRRWFEEDSEDARRWLIASGFLGIR